MACSKCVDGWLPPGPLGLRVKCSCSIESPEKINKKAEAEKPIYHVTGAQKEMAVQKKLIPESRQNDEFDEQFVRMRIEGMANSQKFRVANFNEYVATLNEILVGISVNTFNRSFLIGAPNGFGKTTFVNTCLKRLYSANKKVAPYISLFELGELRLKQEKEILGLFEKKKKDSPEEVKEEETYTWKDYMQADVLFVYFTALENRKVESRVLKIIMDIRGPKCMPTIAMIGSAIRPYIMDHDLKRYVWDDILAYNEEDATTDRLIHRSCYKIYTSAVQAVKGVDF